MKAKHSLTVILILISAAAMLSISTSQVAALTTAPFTSSPSCIEQSGTPVCFVKGLNNAIWIGPNLWSQVPGAQTFESAPAVTSFGGSDLELVAIGVDNTLYWNTWNGASWSGWTNAGTNGIQLYPGSDPACAKWDTNAMECFARGTDNDLWAIVAFGPLPLSGASWSGGWFTPMPGVVLTSGPAASSYALGEEDVFVRGLNNNMWTIHWNGITWSAWKSPFAPALALSSYSPSCTSWALNRIDCFATGTDNLLHHIYTTNGGVSWFAWESLGGGLLTSGPAAINNGVNKLIVYARGYDFGIWYTIWNGATWSTWLGYNTFGGLGLAIDSVYNSPLQGPLGFDLTSNVFDDSGAGYLIGHKSQSVSQLGLKTVFTFSDSTRVAGTGQLLFSPDYSNAIAVGGRNANPTTKFYEDNGNAPIKLQVSGGNVLFYCQALGCTSTTPVLTVSIASLSPTNDYFVMEEFSTGGHTVIMMWGLNAPGTLASGVYFDVLSSGAPSSLNSLSANGYIVHWIGITSNVPLPTDSYTIVYHTPLV